MDNILSRLPKDIADKASLRGQEFAWPLDSVPALIAAAQQAKLLNAGGQLQFRIPNGGTCECHWIEVDTAPFVPTHLSWHERVHEAARIALLQFQALRTTTDFIEEGRKAFADRFDAYVASGGKLSDAMCFVWYLETEDGGKNHV